jgi:aspartate ammonia-lyase
LAEACYGVQTLRSKDNFRITDIPMSRGPYFVKVAQIGRSRIRERGGL